MNNNLTAFVLDGLYSILRFMKLSYKFLCLLLGFTCFSLLLSLALARWSFEQGFNEFIINQERERLAMLSSLVVEEYKANGNSWENVDLANARFFSSPPERRLRPPHHRAPPPPSASYSAPSFINRSEGGPPTALLDENQVLVSGNLLATDSGREVRVPVTLNTQQIGWLVSFPPATPSSETAKAFSRQQSHAIIIIGLVSFGVAIILALGITPRIIRPFKAIHHAVKDLTARRYESKLPNDRSDEFGELMQHINTLAETLKTQEKSKNQWLADISHELRTPLTILAGEIELVKAGIRAFDNKQLISFDQEVSRLSLLVDDLYQLSLSDIGGLRYQFSPLNLSDIVDEQCDKLRARFQQKLLSLHVCATQNAVINADASRIKQLLSNLLINACEYTDAPGEVHISVTTSQTTVTLCVEDSAPGVIKGNESMLFEPLFREDASRARRSSGGGLGLSICKQIAQAHKGEISAMPSMLGGVKINVAFPAITEQKDQ